MSAATTETTIITSIGSSYGAVSASIGIVAIILLIVLLAQQEILRASGSMRLQLWMQALNIATWPLLLVFGLIIVMRFIDLVY